MRLSKGMIAVLLVCAVTVPVAAQTTVFINEIHYDNTSTDVGEAIEIAGPAGTDLSGWSLVLYNGNGGAVYNTTVLSGTIADLCGGFGVIDVTYPVNGIQNGSPDGIALVDATNSVVQFLSYEGSFTAVGGPADGLVSTDIGVSESSGTPVGYSLQLVGTGTVYENFTWQAPALNSFGACNDGQVFSSGPADPVINEFVANHTGADAFEYIEVWGDPSTDYSTLTVLEIEGDGTGAGTVDGVFPVGFTDGSGFWFSGYMSDQLENGSLTLLMVEAFSGNLGDDLDTDNDGVLDVEPWSRVVDGIAVSDGGPSDRSYANVVLAPGFDGVTYTVGGASRIPSGTDTDTVNDWMRNDYDGEGLPGFTGTPVPGEALNTPNAENEAVTVPATLVINEIDYDQPGTDTAEFVEIKNVGAAPVNLDGWTVELVNGNGGGAVVYNAIALPDVNLAPDGYFVICGNAATVYNCDLDVSPDSNLIQNGSPDAVALRQSGTLIDTVSYEGDTGAPYTEGSGSGLEDSGTTGNDFRGISRFPDGVDTNQNNFDLSARCITPGAANVADASSCAEPGPPTLVINEIDYDQPGADTAEFIELTNTGTSPVNLGSFTIELVNGSGGGAAVYNTIALPDVALAPGGYFVVCGNAANVLNCDLDVWPDSNLIQNGSPDAVALMQGSTVIDTVSYEGDTGAPYTEGSGAGLEDSGTTGNDFKSISRLPDGFDSDQNNADLAFTCITPGAANTAADFGCGAGGPVLEIFQIQGSGAHSPFDGSPVSTEDNVVTAVGPTGFYMQTPTERTDGDPMTSDGIFVYTGSPPAVATGDLVDVSGMIAEYYDLTEISGAPTVTVDGSGAVPDPVVLDATLPSGIAMDLAELEPLEGMLVAANGIATGPSDSYGNVAVVARTVRSFREPGIVYPGLPGLPVWDGNPEIFELDPNALGLPDVGMFTNQTYEATGALGFSFGHYQLQPTSLTVGPPPSLPVPARDRMPGEFTIASQNLLRLFSGDIPARAAKLSLYIRTVLKAPDILAVQEVDTLATLEALAARIAADDPAIVYTAYLVEGNDPGGIDVGFLVRDTVTVYAVTQYGKDLEFEFDGRWWTTFDRPPLVLDAEYVGAGEPFPIVVVNNHLRSLDGVDTGNEFARQKRHEQAYQLSLFLQDYQTLHPETPFVVTGDFNSFQFTDGYVDVMGQVTGDIVPSDSLLPGSDEVDPNLFNEIFTLPQEERYSFVFTGNAQAFDYMLASAAIAPAVRGVQYTRGNADSPAGLFADSGTPLRTSDHDAVVLYVLADTDFDGVPNGTDLCPNTVIPESVPTRELGTNRWALVDDDGIFDTNPPGGNGGGLDRAFSIQDTAGCSCEQIIEELHLGQGHVKFGCSTGAMETWIQQVED
ncbi:MAG: lamin tail domain-containing protein [Acidobacteria bacterium]|nr:lamin tail domain-containing protein [Acidobacteriota bacterium]